MRVAVACKCATPYSFRYACVCVCVGVGVVVGVGVGMVFAHSQCTSCRWSFWLPEQLFDCPPRYANWLQQLTVVAVVAVAALVVVFLLLFFWAAAAEAFLLLLLTPWKWSCNAHSARQKFTPTSLTSILYLCFCQKFNRINIRIKIILATAQFFFLAVVFVISWSGNRIFT